jgi:hypothetical protein
VWLTGAAETVVLCLLKAAFSPLSPQQSLNGREVGQKRNILKHTAAAVSLVSH